MDNLDKNIIAEKAKHALNQNALDKGHSDDNGNDDGHDHGGITKREKPAWQEHWDLLLSVAILLVLLVMEYGFHYKLPNPLALVVNTIAYLLAGWNVLRMAFRKLTRADVFNEFVLMSV